MPSVRGHSPLSSSFVSNGILRGSLNSAAFGTVAVAICFDIRFGNLIAAVRQAHPDICAYLLPAAFNLTTGPKAWEVLQRCRAIDNQIYVGMCSPARKYGEEVCSAPFVRRLYFAHNCF